MVRAHVHPPLRGLLRIIVLFRLKLFFAFGYLDAASRSCGGEHLFFQFDLRCQLFATLVAVLCLFLDFNQFWKELPGVALQIPGWQLLSVSGSSTCAISEAFAAAVCILA